MATSFDGGRTFPFKARLDATSDHRPALTSHDGDLFIAWTGSGNQRINVARIVRLGTTTGPTQVVLEGKKKLTDTSDGPPALASNTELLLVAWKDEEDEHVGLRVSRDGAFASPGPWIFRDLSDLGFYVAAYRAAVALRRISMDHPTTLGSSTHAKWTAWTSRRSSD